MRNLAILVKFRNRIQKTPKLAARFQAYLIVLNFLTTGGQRRSVITDLNINVIYLYYNNSRDLS